MNTFKQYFIESLKIEQFITKEMEDHYIARTLTHIDHVQKNAHRLLKLFQVNDDEKFNFLSQVNEHDASKFKNPERDLYILINWKYHIEEDAFRKLNLPKWLLNEMTKITEYHVKHNSHHPEYWDDSLISGFINPENRDDIPEIMIDATAMNKISIMEMICDWVSVSQERGSDPRDWAEMNIGKRWKFSETQINLIFNIIDLLKESNDVK